MCVCECVCAVYVEFFFLLFISVNVWTIINSRFGKTDLNLTKEEKNITISWLFYMGQEFPFIFSKHNSNNNVLWFFFVHRVFILLYFLILFGLCQKWKARKSHLLYFDSPTNSTLLYSLYNFPFPIIKAKNAIEK